LINAIFLEEELEGAPNLSRRSAKGIRSRLDTGQRPRSKVGLFPYWVFSFLFPSNN